MAGRGARGRVDRDGLQPLTQDVTDLYQKASNIVRIGRVEEVDPARRMARVRIGDATKENASYLSDWTRISSDRAGTTTSSRQLSVGEQVMLFSPDGRTENAIIGPSVHNDENESPSDRGDLGKTIFPDGTTMGMDDGGKAFAIIVPTGSLTLRVGGSSITITDDGIDINTGGNVRINGARVDIN